MIKVLVSRITPEGIRLQGEEPNTFLELADDPCFTLKSPVSYDLSISFVNNNILVKGKAWLDMECRCGRCLRPYSLRIINEEVCHFYERPNKNEIDLTEDIREDILITFPYSFECSPGCKGICVKCGRNLNEETCSCKKSKKNKNTVWTELDNLKLSK